MASRLFSSGNTNKPPPKESGGNRSGPSSSNTRSYVTVNCKHYDRNCNMIAPCCRQVVCCHRGHDENGHCRKKMDKSKVTTLVCCSCKQSQNVGKACRFCSRLFGEKGCTKCRMWYSGSGFHCKSCGVCRQGREKDMMHCDTCNKCYPLRSGAYGHTCGSSSASPRCAACGKETFSSRKPSTTMNCGHSIHCECFLERVKTSYSCPIRSCKKTVANMTVWNKALDRLAEVEMRASPSSAIKIYCFDCRATSSIRSGGQFKKCRGANCGSYNTARIPPSQQNAPFVTPPSNIPRN